LSPGDGRVRRPRSPEPEVLGSILDALVTSRPWEAGLALGALGRRWDAVVGERLALECEPAALAGGVLVIKASSSAWAAQIRFLSGEIGGRANECLGADLVREVKVALDADRAQ
jgi:predicted nucleic acid-binding Zn ribbon protein